jgi:TolB-like protein/Flp pilus assembly protein TadD
MAWALGAVLVVAIGTAAIVWYQRTRQQPAVPVTSKTEISALAVLPLANLSGDPGQEYFVEGMQEALITELSKISALRVISRTSTLRYKGTDRLLPQIAKELGVDAVMEGSVLKSGSRLRVTAQLIQVNPERHLWADNFDRDVTDILYLTSDVAQTVARQIKVVLTPAEEANLARARPVNSQAYELYVLGRHYWNERTAGGHQRAIESFRKALSADPQYAPAYAALADTYMLLGEQGMRPQREARSEADAAIRKALELDPNLAEAHASLGQWRFYYDWNWAGAEQAFKRAIELNGGYAPGHQLYGRSLAFLGRYAEAQMELTLARTLDPLSISANAYLFQLYLFQRQYDRAAEQLEQARQLNPNHALVLHNLGELYLAQGRFAEAVKELEKSIGTPDDASAHYLAMLGCAYARANRREDAIRKLRELTRRSEKGLVSAFDMASLYTALGDKEQALAWLERGYEQRDYWLAQLKGWPWFDPLATDPRFQNLLRRMNWPQPQ